MSLASKQTPAFGQADLSNCELEQIHLAASIQPHGALLVVREPDHVIVQTSANACAILGIDPLLGRSLDEIGNLADRLAPYLSEPLHLIPMAVRCHAGNDSKAFDALLHRPPDGSLIVELEEAGSELDLFDDIKRSVRQVVDCANLRTLCDVTAGIFKDLLGYDRVMVYRFDEDGHGEVFSEQREPNLEPFLGNRYPASDIPQMARRLYERNRVRVLVDINYEAVPLLPRLSPITGEDLDMSLCYLRSMSPIHIQYLKNMGVRATLVASLVVGGQLWGLVACHHYSARPIQYERRVACEMLAEAVATRIAALESFLQAQSEITVKRFEQRMAKAVSQNGDWRGALFDGTQSILQPLGASGAALLFEGSILTCGDVPGTQQLRDLGTWLDGQHPGGIYATKCLEGQSADFASLKPVASGMLAVPVSTSPGEYLMWFRPEQVRTVTWGGDPSKAVVMGDDPAQLSPRNSFAKWYQVVKGTSEHWTHADLSAARLIRDTVKDIVLQFRSVRMLIAQDQLAHVSRQVQSSDQPVVIADARGRILLTNDAFEQLLPSTHRHLNMLSDLPALFSDPKDVRARLQATLTDMTAWRAELSLEIAAGPPRSLLLRMDPVFAGLGRSLGFVLLFTDLTERNLAESARQRFQEGILEHNNLKSSQSDSRDDLLYRNLLSPMVGNAQLAAMEITDGAEVSQMPQMLEGVRLSVNRAAELLEHLIWHATGRARNDPTDKSGR